MFYNAKNKVIEIENTTANYICFERGWCILFTPRINRSTSIKYKKFIMSWHFASRIIRCKCGESPFTCTSASWANKA